MPMLVNGCAEVGDSAGLRGRKTSYDPPLAADRAAEPHSGVLLVFPVVPSVSLPLGVRRLPDNFRPLAALHLRTPTFIDPGIA